MEYLKTWLLFIRCIFCYSFSIKNKASLDYYLAGKCLFSLSFRYSEQDKKSFSFFLKCFLKAVLLKKISPKAFKMYSPGDRFFYDVAAKSENQRTTYLNYFLKGNINGGVWKEHLLGYFSFLGKIAQLLFLSALFLMLLPIALFNKLPASLGLIFNEYIEAANLIKALKQNKVKTLYYFCIYEKDSNVAALALQTAGIAVVKIASEVPLFFWNKIIIADTLIICDSNQLDEVQLYKDTIRIKGTEFWGPERCVEYIDRYKEKSVREKANNKTIGFYSTASYIRNMEGHISQKDMLEQENTLKSLLAGYLQKNTSVKLIIFLHPKEKGIKYADTVQDHYLKYFKGLNYTLESSAEPSSYHFEMAELGVSFYSTIIYERLFFGFKCLLFTAPEAAFPIQGTPLSKICANNVASLSDQIDLFLKLTAAEYFSLAELKSRLFLRTSDVWDISILQCSRA